MSKNARFSSSGTTVVNGSVNICENTGPEIRSQCLDLPFLFLFLFLAFFFFYLLHEIFLKNFTILIISLHLSSATLVSTFSTSLFTSISNFSSLLYLMSSSSNTKKITSFTSFFMTTFPKNFFSIASCLIAYGLMGLFSVAPYQQLPRLNISILWISAL